MRTYSIFEVVLATLGSRESHAQGHLIRPEVLAKVVELRTKPRRTAVCSSTN
jgi:hypothetical protein